MASLSRRLLHDLPELRGCYRALLTEWHGDPPGDHVVFGDLLNIYLDVILQSGDKKSIRRVFTFLESLAYGADLQTQDLLTSTVLRHLAGVGLVALAWENMGPSTRTLLLEVVMPVNTGSVEALLAHDERWRRLVDRQGGPERLQLQDVLDIRRRLSDELGLEVQPPNALYNAYAGVDLERYTARFKQEIGDLEPFLAASEPKQVHLFAQAARRIRESLFREFGLCT